MTTANKNCKICRRAGEKLFLKGEKCYSPKCALVKKPYPAGIHGKKTGRRRRRALSEYASQLRSKQKLKFLYGLRERQFSNYIKSAVKKAGPDTAGLIVQNLELRLDNAVFRLGFAGSRTQARQLVSHGHILINNRKVNIPSFQLKLQDKVAIQPQSLNKKVFLDLDIFLKKYQPPNWLKLDKAKKQGEVVGLPALEMAADADLNSVIEFYSR